ncbi:MAG: C-terminal peptidase prc [Planctomycetota bacterium]|jgi:C-terminal peptidase prc
MRAQITVALALALPILASTSAAAPFVVRSQNADELREILDDRLANAETMSVDDIWSDAQTVAVLIGDEYGEAFDRALDARLAQGGSGHKGTLFMISARLMGDEPDLEVLADSLTRLLAVQDEPIAIAACDLFATAGFEAEDVDLRETIADKLITLCEDAGSSAKVRSRAALAAHQVGLGRQLPRPLRVLYGFLESSEPSLRALGALGLGQLGLVEEVAGVEEQLESMSGLPGEDGRLASSFLKQVQLRRYHDSVLARVRSTESNKNIASGMSPDLQRVENLLEFVQTYHLEGDRVTRDDLLQAAMNGMLQSLDRHSTYFDPNSYKRFEQDLEAEYGGIGAYVGVDREDGLFTITRPIYSGPAYKAGLTTDDKIVRIGDWPTIGEETDAVIKRLKGRPDTDVELYVWRRGMDPSLIERPTEDMLIKIKRGTITIPPVHYEMLPGKVGLVELTTFSRVASSEMYKALMALKEQGAKGIVLDLRNNTGGLLQEARNVADLFLPKGKVVVSTHSRARESREYATQFDYVVEEDIPVVVLINRFSASAAEIVSGALQDHGRATLVGQRSYGKGSVQNLFRMPGESDDLFADENGNRRHDNWETLTRDQNGNGEFDYAPRIKLTIERYLLPTGRSIHRELDEEGNITSAGGVDPDVVVAAKRHETWRLMAMRKVQDTRKLRTYAQDLHKDQPDLAAQLAAGDSDEWSRYPEFEELYNGLGTVLSRADVRFLLRMQVRRAVQDSRGSAFPLGDYQEDLQLQQAITKIFEARETGIDTIDAFARTFDEATKDLDAPPAALADSGELSDALQLLAEADVAEGKLSKERLAQLRQLLESLSKKN